MTDKYLWSSPTAQQSSGSRSETAKEMIKVALYVRRPGDSQDESLNTLIELLEAEGKRKGWEIVSGSDAQVEQWLSYLDL